MALAPIQLIGIDCATEDARIGLAHGSADGADLHVLDARQCSRDQPAMQTIGEWITTREHTQTLLAIDAPLGWPAALGEALAGHQAGDAISVGAHDLFRRDTDRFIKRTLGKQALDVGADRIARTAHAALGLLGELRRRLGDAIPLAWTPTLTDPHQRRAPGHHHPFHQVEGHGALTLALRIQTPILAFVPDIHILPVQVQGCH
jgi:hypothetical protein